MYICTLCYIGIRLPFCMKVAGFLIAKSPAVFKFTCRCEAVQRSIYLCDVSYFSASYAVSNARKTEIEPRILRFISFRFRYASAPTAASYTRTEHIIVQTGYSNFNTCKFFKIKDTLILFYTWTFNINILVQIVSVSTWNQSDLTDLKIYQISTSTTLLCFDVVSHEIY